MKLTDKERQALFAALAVIALAAAAYAIFFSEPQDLRSDGKEFYYALKGASRAGILYDVRGVADDAQKSAVYQCGVDIIGKGRLAGKEIEIIACDDSGCLSAQTSSNGTSAMTMDQARKRLSPIPYVRITAGENSSYSLFQRHIEIVIGKTLPQGASCDISAVETE